MKRTIAFALVLVMLISVIPFAAVHAADADTTVYFEYNGSDCSVPAENEDWNNGRKTESNGFNLDYYEKDLFAPATALESGKVYKALYLFTINRVNNEYGWEVKCMPTEEYYYNITNGTLNDGSGAQKTVVSVPFKVTNPDDVKLKLWTHGALVDGSQLDKIMVVGADFDAYTIAGYDKVVEGLANAGSKQNDNKPAGNEYTVSKRPLELVLPEDGTVPGLTMNSYGMSAMTNGWGDAMARFMGDPYGGGYGATHDGTLLFDQSIDEILALCDKFEEEGTVDGIGNYNRDYVYNKYEKDKGNGLGNAGESYLLHWTGTFTANQDVTFTPAAKKLDNGLVFFIGESADKLEKKFEYWGAKYFDTGNETLTGITGDVTLENGKEYAVEIWFLELGGGEALDFGGVVSGEYKNISTFGTFTLSEEYWKFGADRWGNTDNPTHPYVKVFMNALGDNYVGTGSWEKAAPHHGGNGAQCIPDNMHYDVTIEGLLAASRKFGPGIVVPTITKLTAGFVDESFVTIYDGTFTVEKTGNYLFGCLDIDNGLMIEIIDGNETTRVFELWANRVWQDWKENDYNNYFNDPNNAGVDRNILGYETWYTTSVRLEAGKTYKIHAAFLEMDGGQVVSPVVKYSETDNFDGAEAKDIADVLAFRTTVPASDKIAAADAAKIYGGNYSLTDKVAAVSTNKGTWGDGAVENIFDGNIDTKYGAGGIAHQIDFTTSELVTITHYGLITANDNDKFIRTPMRWTLLGSDDGVVYTVIDHVNRGCGDLGWFASELGIYEVDSPAEYKYYRFEFQTNFDGGDNDGAGSFAELLLYNYVPIEPKVTNTKAQLSWTLGSEDGLSIFTNVPYDINQEVTIKGFPVDGYAVVEAEDGTTTIVISVAYLETLGAGRKTISISTEYGDMRTTITVASNDPVNTTTGDVAAIVIATVAIASLAGAAVVATRRKKIED